MLIWFQSRYREAFHFRFIVSAVLQAACPGFNLVIERLFISGPAQKKCRPGQKVVSISLSRGFSFQVSCERLVSCALACRVSISLSRGFSFQVPNADACHAAVIWFQSRYREAFHFRFFGWIAYEITEYLFQSRYREAFHFRDLTECLRLPCQLFQSRYREAFHFRLKEPRIHQLALLSVSISLSRGFSFQGPGIRR